MRSKADREDALFQEATRLAVPDRLEFLNRVCHGDSVLRQRLEERLAAHEKLPCASLADTGLTTVTVPSEPNRPISLADEFEGSLIGRYKLIEMLGEGGFGVVWLAEQKEPVRRKVALKIIKLGMDTKQFVARFEAERQALAIMDHPNIAKVLDAGATALARPYFVMELVRGIRITDYCDQASLTTKERIDLFIKVCQAIQHAHQKGIVHRDIKPSNVIVGLHDGVPVPKVIDFGIAKATQGVLTDKTIHTQFQQFLGTPAYMSPEQAEMSGLDIDTRADIYSLGVLLYELLVGSTPFDAQELMSQGIAAMRKTIREKEPPRPSTRLATLEAGILATAAKRRSADSLKLLHQLKGDLDWIVLKCLEKDRQRRYETANGLAVDLRRYLTNEPVVARPPSAVYRFQKAFRRNRVVFGAATAVAAALLIGIVASSRQATKAARAALAEFQQRRAAQEAQARAQSKQKEAEAERERADIGQRAARENELVARQNLYSSDMNLALQAVEVRNVGYALELLNRHRPQLGQPDLRGWEWRYLWKLTRSDALLKLGSHSNTVYNAVFSPQGDILATCSEDHTVRLWDIATGRESAVLPHDNFVKAAAFFEDGKHLATACGDGNLRLWDVATRSEIARNDIGKIRSPLAFAPHGELIALSGDKGTVNLWDVVKQKKIMTLDAEGHLFCLTFSLDGKLLAAGYRFSNVVRVWNISHVQTNYLLTNKNSGTWVDSLAFSSDGNKLASACHDGSIHLWDLATRQVIKTLAGHSSWIPTIAFSPDDKMLASASTDHTVKLWDIDTGQSATLRGHLNEVWALAVAPNGRTLATGTKVDGTVALWSALPAPEEKTSQTVSAEGQNSTRYPELSPDGTALLVPLTGNAVGVWDTAALKETARFALNFNDVTRFAISPFGKHIAIGEADGTIKLVTVSQQQPTIHLVKSGAAVEQLAFSSDGNKVAASSADRKFRVWEITTQQLLTSFHVRENVIAENFAFSTDSATIGIGFGDGTAGDIRCGQRQSIDSPRWA
ncbi:MAG: serine/threonine-protein kinase [Verrucomicrobiota bacterium]